LKKKINAKKKQRKVEKKGKVGKKNEKMQKQKNKKGMQCGFLLQSTVILGVLGVEKQ
jgi:hypothetical protein